MTKIVDEKVIDGILHYRNENGDYRQYSLEALAIALTAERSMNRRMHEKQETMRLLINQISYSAKTLDEVFKL